MRVALNSLRYSDGATGGNCAAGGEAFGGAALSGAESFVGSTTFDGTRTGSALSICQSNDTCDEPVYVNVRLKTAPPLKAIGSYAKTVAAGGEPGGDAGAPGVGFAGRPAVAGVPSSIVSLKSFFDPPAPAIETTNR